MSSRSTSDTSATRKTTARATCWRSAPRPARCSWSYRATADIDRIVAGAVREEPLFDFSASDGVQHVVWRVAASVRDALVAAFAPVPALYIADGHHRAASAARARQEIRDAADRP